MTRGRYLFLFLLLASTCAEAKRLPVRVYTSSDGLALDSIGCIFQGSRDFLWFCTAEGLSRFDGYEFTTYTTADGLPSNWVFDFLATRRGVYWVATTRGLCRVVEPEDSPHGPNWSHPSSSAAARFVKYGSPNLSQTVTALAEGPDGKVWCGTSHRLLYRMDGNPLNPVATPVDLHSELASAGSDYATALVVDHEGAVWMGTLSGLYRYAPGGRAEHYTVRDGLPENVIHSLFVDSDGRLWIGTGRGLCRTVPRPSEGQSLIERVYTTRDGLQEDWINDILRSADGTLWVGTSRGLAEFAPDSKPGTPKFRDHTAEIGAGSIGVDALAEDREGNLWLGTGGRGAIKMVRNGFSTYGEADGLPSADIFAIFEDNLGELCLLHRAPKKLSLYHFNGQRFGVIEPPLPSAVTSFGWGEGQIAFQDHTGEWWVATSQGLCRFSKAASVRGLDRAHAIHVYTTRDGLPGNDIFRIFEDSHGDIWISTTEADGLARWERKTNSIHDWPGWPRSGRLPSGFAEDAAGDLWVGLWQGGLLRYRDGRMEHFPPGGGVPPSAIGGLHIDHAGRLWASASAGLCRVDDPASAHPHFISYGVAQGLSSAYVKGVAADRLGNVFIATARGVDRLEPESGRIRHYTAADGLAPGQPQLLLGDRLGALWVITRGGASQLVPQPESRRSAPSVLITGLRIRSISYPVSPRGEASITGLELKPNENQLAIDFVSPSFAAGEALRYQYMLEGADRDWSAPGPERTVNYASLSPGTYRFQVRAIASNGVVTPTPAHATFTILPPLWRRWWVLGLEALALAAGVYAAHRYRTQHLLALERVRMRIATDLHDDVGSGLSQIAILGEVARLDASGEHGREESLARISSIARELVDSMSDIVWSISPRKDRLHDLSERMREVAGDLLVPRSVRFELVPLGARDSVKLSPDLRRQVFLIFKECVHNVARHSGSTQARIEFGVEDKRLVLRVSDNGCGLDEGQDGHGHGLEGMRERARSLGGQIEFLSSPEGGLTVTLHVPLH